jgi:hypothetical protein
VKNTADLRMKKAKPDPIVLANWGRRFIAWFVDYLIINVILAYFRLEEMESKLMPTFLLPRLPGIDLSLWSPLSILIFFMYWTFSEWYFGRSIGQLLLNIRLADRQGGNASFKTSAIQSVGKSVFLPFDCLVGWTYRPSRELRQRFFNKLSNTIVIFRGASDRTVRQAEYAKET